VCTWVGFSLLDEIYNLAQIQLGKKEEEEEEEEATNVCSKLSLTGHQRKPNNTWSLPSVVCCCTSPATKSSPTHHTFIHSHTTPSSLSQHLSLSVNWQQARKQASLCESSLAKIGYISR